MILRPRIGGREGNCTNENKMQGTISREPLVSDRRFSRANLGFSHNTRGAGILGNGISAETLLLHNNLSAENTNGEKENDRNERVSDAGVYSDRARRRRGPRTRSIGAADKQKEPQERPTSDGESPGNRNGTERRVVTDLTEHSYACTTY